MAEDRSAYFKAINEMRKANIRTGNLQFNNAFDINSVDNELTTTSASGFAAKQAREYLSNQGSQVVETPTWYDHVFGFIDETAAKFGAGFVKGWEGILDLGANALGWLTDLFGGDGTVFTDWAKQDIGTALAEWTKTYANFTPWAIVKNIANGNYTNSEYWHEAGQGAADILDTALFGIPQAFGQEGDIGRLNRNYREDSDRYYGFHDEYDTGFGEFLGGLAGSFGEMLPSIMIGNAVGGASAVASLGKAGAKLAQGVSLGAFGLAAAGNASEEALQEGATSGQALGYGLVKGGIEVASEVVVGKALNGVAKVTKLDKVLGKFGGNVNGVKFGSQMFKEASRKGVAKELVKGMFEEGMEEVFSDLLSPVAESIYKGGSALKQYSEGDYWKQVAVSFASGAAMGGITNGLENYSSYKQFGAEGRVILQDMNDVFEQREKYNELRARGLSNEQALSELNLTADEITGKMQEICDKIQYLEQTSPDKLKNVFNQLGIADKSGVSGFKEVFDKSYSQNYLDTLRKSVNGKFGVDIQNSELIDDSAFESVDAFEKLTGEKLSTADREKFQKAIDGNGRLDAFIVNNKTYYRQSEDANINRLFFHEIISHGVLDTSKKIRNDLINTMRKESKEFDKLWKETYDQVKADYADFKLSEQGLISETLAHILEKSLDSESFIKELDYSGLNKFQRFLKKTIDSLGKGKDAKKKTNPIANEIVDKLNNYVQENVSKLLDTRARAARKISNKYGLPFARMILSDDGKQRLLGTIGADGGISFSYRTYKEGGRAKLQEYLKNMGYAEKEINETLKNLDEMGEVLTQIAKKEGYKNLEDLLDKGAALSLRNGRPIMSVLTTNGDYILNFDLSQTCKKKIAYQEVIDELARSGYFDNGNTLTPDQISKIYDILRDKGLETPCTICFVESKRLLQFNWARDTVELWNEAVRKIKGADFNEYYTEKVSNDLTEAAAKETDELYKKILSEKPKVNAKGNIVLGGKDNEDKTSRIVNYIADHGGELKLFRVSDLLTAKGLESVKQVSSEFFAITTSSYGAGTPKMNRGFTPYDNGVLLLDNAYAKLITGKSIPNFSSLVKEIRKEYKEKGIKGTKQQIESEALRRIAFYVGGVRFQSFSDFVIDQIFDVLQLNYDLMARKLPAHDYTKEDSYIHIFGLNGAKHNMSLINQFHEETNNKVLGGLKEINDESEATVGVKNEKLAIRFIVKEKGTNKTISFDKAINDKGELADANYELVELPIEDKEEGSKLFTTTFTTSLDTTLGYAKHNFRDSNGKPIQSFKFDKAIEFLMSKEYSKYCGTIAIAFSDAHARLLMRSQSISMVIPYHASGMIAAFSQIYKFDGVKDFTNEQTEGVDILEIEGIDISKEENSEIISKIKKALKKQGVGFNWNKELQKHGNDQDAPFKTVQEYLEHCAKIKSRTIEVKYTVDGKAVKEKYKVKFTNTPKFSSLINEKNYYKVLTDFSLFDVDGNYCPQEVVNGRLADDAAAYIEKKIKNESKKIYETLNKEIDSVMSNVQGMLKETSGSSFKAKYSKKKPLKDNVFGSIGANGDKFGLDEDYESATDFFKNEAEDYESNYTSDSYGKEPRINKTYANRMNRWADMLYSRYSDMYETNSSLELSDIEDFKTLKHNYDFILTDDLYESINTLIDEINAGDYDEAPDTSDLENFAEYIYDFRNEFETLQEERDSYVDAKENIEEVEIPDSYVYDSANLNNSKVYFRNQVIKTVRSIAKELRAKSEWGDKAKVVFSNKNLTQTIDALFKLFNKKNVTAEEVSRGIREIFGTIEILAPNGKESDKLDSYLPTSQKENNSLEKIVAKNLLALTLNGADSQKTKNEQKLQSVKENAQERLDREKAKAEEQMNALVNIFKTTVGKIKSQLRETRERLIYVRRFQRRLDARKFAKNVYKEITGDSLGHDGLATLFNIFEGIRSTNRGFSSRDIKGRIDQALKVYDETIDGRPFEEVYPNIPYDPLIRQTLEELRDLIPDPKLQKIKHKDGSESERLVYPSLSLEALEKAIELYDMVEKVNNDAIKLFNESVKPSAIATAKAIKSSKYGKRKGRIANLLRGYKRAFMPAYMVVREILGGSSALADKVINEWQAQASNKALFVGRYSETIRQFLKKRNLLKDIENKKIKIRGKEISLDMAIFLYNSLSVDANAKEIDECGVKFRDEDGRTIDLAGKGEAQALKTELDSLLNENEKGYANDLLTLMNGDVKQNYIDWFISRYGKYNHTNEIGEVNANKYWTITREYEYMTNLEKVIKTPAAVFKNSKRRVKNKNAIMLHGATSVVSGYVESLANEIYIKPTYREVVQILNVKYDGERNLMQELSQLEAKDRKYLEDTLKDMLGYNDKGVNTSLLEKMSSRFAVAKLSLNIGTMLKQFASIYTSNIPLSKSAKGLLAKMFNKEAQAEFKDLIQEIGSLKYRESSKAVLLSNAGVNRSRGAVGRALDKTAEIGMYGISKVDLFTVSTGVYSLMVIGEQQYGYKIGSKENKEFVKSQWSEFELSQIGSGALSKNAIARGDYGALVRAIFGFMQGANRAALGSFYNKVMLYNRNRKLNRETLESDLSKANKELKDFIAENNLTTTKDGVSSQDLASLSEDQLNEYTHLKANVEYVKSRLEDFRKYEVAGAKKLPINIVSGLIAQGLLISIINFIMKRLKGKKDWDEIEEPSELAAEFGLNTFANWIPMVNAITSMIQGYDVQVPSIAILNECVSVINSMKDGNWQKGIQQLALLLGDSTGIPFQTIYDYLYGAVNTINKEAGLRMKSLFYYTSPQGYSKAMAEAKENGKESKVRANLSVLMDTYKGGASDDVKDELSRLYIVGYNAIPSTLSYSYVNEDGESVEFTTEERSLMDSFYKYAKEEADALIKSSTYKALSDESKAKALKKIFDAYKDASKSFALKIGASSRIAEIMRLTSGNIKIANYIAHLNAINNIKETKRLSRKEAVLNYINKIRGLSKVEKLLLVFLTNFGLTSQNKVMLGNFLIRNGASKKAVKELLN